MNAFDVTWNAYKENIPLCMFLNNLIVYVSIQNTCGFYKPIFSPILKI